MKAYILDPLRWMGARAGYTRPLDRHDFPGGKYPNRLDRFVLAPGEMRRFANLSGIMGSTGIGIDTLSYTSDQKHPLGTIAITKDGRTFRYVQAGDTVLVVGNVIQSPAIVPDHLAMTAAVTAIGATRTVFTLGATAATANQYAEGYLGVSTTPDLGRTYGVSGHAAVALSGSMTLNLNVDDPVQVAFSTATRLGLIANKGKGVIQFPVTTATGTCVGVAHSIITAAYYGWVQSRGLASVLISGTPALGAQVMTPSAAAGSAIILTATNAVVAQLVGRMAQVGVDTKCNFVDLDID